MPSDAAPTSHTETLLRAVVDASRALAAEPDLARGMADALAAIGKGTGLDRVYIVRYDHSLHAGFFVAEHCAPGISSVVYTMGAGPYAYVDYEEVWRPLLAGQTYSSPTHSKTGVNAELNQALGTKSDLFVPIFVEGTFWGTIGFDDCTSERVYAGNEIQVLRGAASTLAAAISRVAADHARLLVERARTDDAHALNHLLEGVVAASRALLDEPDFQAGLESWLATLAKAVDADRAAIGGFAAPEDPSHVAFTRVDWAKPGLPLIWSFHIPASADFVAWAERLQRGESIWAHRDELLDPASVRYWESTDCFTNLLVPVVMDRRTVAWLAFDWSTRREWRPTYGTLLRTAADGAAAILKRNDAVRLALAEREARAAESARLTEQLRTVVSSARELIDAPEFEPGLIRWLGRFGEATAAIRATFYDLVDHPETGRRTCRMLAEWTRPGITGSIPVSFTEPYIIDPRGAEAAIDRLTSGESVTIHTADCDEPMRSMLASQGNVSVVAVPIFLDGHQWGCLSFDHGERRELNPSDTAVLQTAADTLAAILKRNEAVRAAIAEREARAAELAALNRELERRNRLLAASAEAIKGLLSASDLPAAISDALRMMGDAADMHRIKVILQRPDPATGETFHELVHEWWSPELSSQTSLGLTRFPDRLLGVYLEPLQAGRSIWQMIEDTPEFLREPFQLTGMQSMGVVPIFAGSRYVGLVAFDDCRRRRHWSPMEMDALTIAARGLGATILGEQLAHEKIEAVAVARAASARARADELGGLNALLTRRSRLLAAVTEVSQLLLTGADPATLLQSIANVLGPASGADRAGFMLATPPDAESASGYLKLVAEWVAPGVPRQLDVPSALTMNLDLVPIAEWLTNGLVIATPVELDEALRAGRTASRIQSELGIPIIVEGELWGTSGFDDCTGGRVWDEGEITALKIANALIANAVSRCRADEAQLSAEGSRRTAVQTERNRMAREIHDTLAQSFTGILLQLEAADLLRESGDPRASERYRKIRTQAQLGLAETRRTALALAPEALNEGLLPALSQLCQRSHVEERMRCTFTYEGLARRLDPAREERLLRVAKEALSNAVRHGRATEISLHLAFAPDEVTLSVTDNGVGFTVSDSSGLGLPNMRAALAEAGGALRVASAPAAGTTITAIVPLTDPPSAKHPIAPRRQKS